MSENPYEPSEVEVLEAEAVDDGPESPRFSDTVIGLNLRWKDNLFQLGAIVVCTAVGAGFGHAMSPEHAPGVVVGGFLGFLVGALASGFVLMIYRAVRRPPRR